jgi:zinc transport system substrate-binding protein
LTIIFIFTTLGRVMHTRHVRRFASLGSLLAMTVAGVAACGNATDTATAGGRTEVVGAFYPVAWLAQRVGGNAVEVNTLTTPGAEPHDLELTPRQVVDVGQATYVVYVKGVQPAVDEAVDQHAKDHALDAAGVVKTLPATAAEPGGEGHTTSYDPHIWLDPSRLATVATALGDRLAAADPAHATGYRAGAKTVATELTALDQEFRDGLRTCTRKTIVTSHAAFGYLADRYGLTQVPIAGIEPQSEPSPKRLAELTAQVRATGTTTIFTETLVSPKVSQTLAREAGVRTATLDPVEGVAKGSKDDYLSIMRRNLATLRTALECT